MLERGTRRVRGRLLLLVAALFVALSGATAYAGPPLGELKEAGTPAADQLGITVVRDRGLKASDTMHSAMRTPAASQSRSFSMTESWLTGGIVLALGAVGVALQRRERLRSGRDEATT